MMKLTIFVLLSTTLISCKAYHWRDYDDFFGPPCYAYYLVWPAIPRDLCLTTHSASSDLDVSLEECDFGQDPPHRQIWYSSRGDHDLVKTSMDCTDWQTADKCLTYVVDGAQPSGPIELRDCDEALPSFYWFMQGNIFWDWDDQKCMIPEHDCPMPGAFPIMSNNCDYGVYNYGHTWHIQYVEPVRAQNSIYLISAGAIIQDNDGIIEVADGNDIIQLDQQRDGNFKVMRNNNVLFHAGSHSEASLDYYTKLQGDCNLITRKGRPWAKGDVVWKSDIRIDSMPGGGWESPECYLALNKDDDTLSIYVGTPDKVYAELWNSDW